MLRRADLTVELDDLRILSRSELRALWKQELGEQPPVSLGRDVLALAIAYALQERVQGGLTKPIAKELDRLLDRALCDGLGLTPAGSAIPLPRTGTILVREWKGATHHVTITDDGFIWNGRTHRSLSHIARVITGTKWSGPRFFGMREKNSKTASRTP
jgi:hypothetical protein